MFTDYINKFVKIKQEVSGWPKWCKTDDDKRKYIQDYYDREGIWLNANNIKKNPGLRQLAKLMLNSFWGKFGQRTNLPQKTYVSDVTVFFDMMTGDNQEIKNVRFVNEEIVQVDWVHKEGFIDTSGITNVVIAAYTTAQARLKLYQYLERLDRRALYADTDSIIFTIAPGEWEPELGDYLGDLTNEIPDNDIDTFVTGEPKNYAKKLRKPIQTFAKVRGITLNHKNSLDINFYTILSMVMHNRDGHLTVVDQNRIVRDSQTAKIITKTEAKDYEIVFDKRVIQNNLFSVPYGM